MNVKEASEIFIKGNNVLLEKDSTTSISDLVEQSINKAIGYGASKGFLECHKLYKPLVEALESISKNSCCDQCQEAKLVSLKPLEHYRKNILGEK
jgi:hypothetical protein